MFSINHRNGDLRRWWYTLPWIFVYGLNIIGLLAAGIVGLFTLEGIKKLYGLIPLVYGEYLALIYTIPSPLSSTGCSLFLFYILVLFFVLEQKRKLTGVAVRPFPSVSSLVTR